MIAFGSSITDPDTYERCAGRGIELVREPDSVVFAHAATGSLARNYNLLLDQARDLEGLEALVLLHQDAEIVDPRFCATLREAIADPMVAVVGCVGSIGARSIAWWEGSVTWASFTHRYPEHEYGGGEFPAFGWGFDKKPAYAQTGEVDNVDGFVLALTPWAIENLRFDESLGTSHGYDADLCLQAREAGRKVVTADFQVVHHHSLELIGDPFGWMDAHIRVAEKWDDRLPRSNRENGDLAQRARQAEAEAGLMRLQLAAKDLQTRAQARHLERQIEDLREHLEGIERSQAWKLTRPLRALSSRLRRRNGSG
jgi:GT2 family glycosyltransferase